MSTLAKNNVDYRLLNNLSNLVICSHCLRSGKVTPIPQIITRQRPPTNLCRSCRTAQSPDGLCRTFGKLLKFPG